MKNIPQTERPRLIVMLTYNDMTVADAEEVFEACSKSKAMYWGMKEKPLPVESMKRVYGRMKECGKTTVLEVVGYDEAAAMDGARLAVECGVDILMGTKYHPAVASFCRAHGVAYMPFVGTPQGRPSVLTGEVEEIVDEARRAIADGAFGVDLLGYRYTGDAAQLNKTVSAKAGGPVCLAGSIDSFRRLDEVLEAAPWGFTIGSAFFDKKFGGSFLEQVDKVVEYINCAG